MNKPHLVCWLCVCVLVLAPLAVPLPAQDTSKLNTSTLAVDLPHKLLGSFSLPATGGRTVQLTTDAKATVVCFLGTECPLARQYAPRLQKMADAYASRGVIFMGIDSNLQDTLDEVAQFAQANNIRFPIGMDYDQKVAELLGAQRTPEVVVLDAQLAVRYQGRIDDQYLPGLTKPQATVSELAMALDAILADQPINVTKTQSVGCRIGRPKQPGKSEVTYTAHIARIFRENCVECHRSGEIGPFAMTVYEELRGWGDMIVEVINDGRMPPWHASPGHVPLQNARSMREEDKQLVRQWVDAGMPYGDASQLPSETSVAKSQWYLSRDPDLELAMRSTPYTIPAEGAVDYQYFVVDPGLTEDRWIKEAQVIPGNAGVVHHAIVFIRPPDGVDFRGVSWLTAYVPGQRQHLMPAGSARRIPAGSKFVFQMHYTPNGTEQQDITRIGMIFADPAEVTREVITIMAINQDFEIPPNVADHPVNGRIKRFPKGGQLLAVSPHMHVRGKSFQLRMKQAGQENVLLDVPKYDFNWQHTYEFAAPIELDAVDGIEFTARFDNSSGNPVNPNPNTLVTWVIRLGRNGGCFLRSFATTRSSRSDAQRFYHLDCQVS